MNLTTELRYGDVGLSLTHPGPPSCQVLSAASMPKQQLDREKVEVALANPVGCKPFDQVFKPGEKLTIIVPDVTRYSGMEIFLLPVIDRLNTIGVPDNNITIIFATGIHRGHSEKERVALVGPDVARRILLVDHDSHNSEMESIYVPEIDSKVMLNRKVLQCDKLIITGVISYHYLAGFGGGRKAIKPGVSSFDDALKFHFYSLNKFGSGRHPNAKAGNIDGNQMHWYANSVMRAVNPAFAINTVQDAHGNIVEIFAGETASVFDLGRRSVVKLSGVMIDSLADVVVASCGGYPNDINMVQVHKTLEHVTSALKTGGKLFLLAACPDKFGSEYFRKWFDYGSPDQIEDELRRNFHINGQTAYSVALKAQKFCITMLCDGIASEDILAMGITSAESKESFLSEVDSALRAAKISYVIAQGGSLLPIRRRPLLKPN